MGNYLPTPSLFGEQRESTVESIDGNTGNIYRYPPKSGAYFADHFVMAGQKFTNVNSETFLFGEINDLNYLSTKPVPFPYNPPGENEPSNTIRCLVHLRKESLKLVKEQTVAGCGDIYRVEFTFDSDVRCGVRIYMMAKENVSSGVACYTPRKPELRSEITYFNKGPNQTFSTSTFNITPDEFQPSELNYIVGSAEIPFVVQITAEDPDVSNGHSESTFAGIEKLSDGSYTIKFMKQKIMIDGFSMMIQELYGIENKKEERKEDEDEYDDEDDTKLCVVCISHLRDTILLPCRHLCLCDICAAQMRNKQNRCPICRANFHALLRLKGVRRKQNCSNNSEDAYEEVPLIEALNGNFQPEEEQVGNIHRNSSRSRRSLKSRLGSHKNTKIPSPSVPIETPNEEDDEKNGIPLATMVRNTWENEDIGKENNDHLEPSLPGTPLEREDSDYVMNNSALMNSSRGSLVIARAQVTTPSHVIANEPDVNSPVDDETT